MATHNVRLSEQQDRFIGEVIGSGRYHDASEVMREGLRLLERREIHDASRLARLRAAVAEGDAAIERGDYIDLDDDQISDWLASLETRRSGPK